MRTTPPVTRIEPLDNPVRPYAWGSRTAIPALLGVPPTGQPQAELWIGAHPAAPSRLASGGTLPARIAADPAGELGPELVDRFGPELPFLLKVIAAAEPLSLQAHPGLARARAGFAAEEARGIPRDAPERNYPDPNHKPELVCAVTPFAALAGFRPVPATVVLLAPLVAAVPALAPYAQLVRSAPLPDVVGALLTDASADLVAAVAAGCAALDDPAYRTVTELARRHPGDPGVLVTLLLNRVDLAPGEALFLAAGNLHCYLHGTAVEVLANSDNVLRGGLTGKHIDVPELLAVLDPRTGPPPRLVPTGSGPVESYRPPVPDFRLDRVTLSAIPVPIAGPSLVLVLDGAALADGVPLAGGGSGWIPYGRTVPVTGEGLLVRATAGTG
ncbi:MAG TPA: mannose-6-phosphate isomerase, class I [Mycobacteriales bacterium]